MAEKKGKKLRRCAKQSGYYKSQFFTTDKNRVKRWGRYLRQHPENVASALAYNMRYNMGAEGHMANATAQAKRRNLNGIGLLIDKVKAMTRQWLDATTKS